MGWMNSGVSSQRMHLRWRDDRIAWSIQFNCVSLGWIVNITAQDEHLRLKCDQNAAKSQAHDSPVTAGSILQLTTCEYKSLRYQVLVDGDYRCIPR
jgi:hypothetical protein